MTELLDGLWQASLWLALGVVVLAVLRPLLVRLGGVGEVVAGEIAKRLGRDVQYFIERDDKAQVQYISVRGTMTSRSSRSPARAHVNCCDGSSHPARTSPTTRSRTWPRARSRSPTA